MGCHEIDRVLVVNAALQVPGQGGRLCALLVCPAGSCGCASEVVLWGVNTGGELFALGLESGSLHGSWKLPGGDEVVTASLKGDHAHLWILLVRGTGAPTVLSMPYP